MNARRRGTASTKTRGEIAMTGAKAWRQKGTGRARAGALSTPNRYGGGVAFGPKPRHYTVKVNKNTFRVHDDAHKTQVRQAIEEVFGVRVQGVRTSWVKSKPKRRGWSSGKTRRWKKAVVQLHPEDSIELFEGQDIEA